MIPNLSEVNQEGRDDANFEWQWVRKEGIGPKTIE